MRPASRHFITYKLSHIFHSSLFICVSNNMRSSCVTPSVLMFSPLLFMYRLNTPDYINIITLLTSYAGTEKC